MHALSTLALGCRVLIALCTKTFFQPDEYYQALEPAYHAVFGYGHLTWEWLAPQPIRSIIYPAINIPVYWILKITTLADAGRLGDWLMVRGTLHGNDTRRMLTPHIGCLPENIAWRSRVLYRRLYRRNSAHRARQRALLSCSRRITLYFEKSYLIVNSKMLLSLTSMFNALALSRSLSNSLETSLTTIAFAFYPWDASDKLSPHLLFNRYIHTLHPQRLGILCII